MSETEVLEIPPELAFGDDTVVVEAERGVHRWVVVVTFELSSDECLDVHRQAQRLVVDRQHLRGSVGPICIICEEAWLHMHNRPCPGVRR